jgi:hypothetical protein
MQGTFSVNLLGFERHDTAQLPCTGTKSISEANLGRCFRCDARDLRVSDHPPSRYRAYILRVWQDDTSQGWRFSLEEIGRSLPRRGFRSLGTMAAFIAAELEGSLPAQEEQPAADHEG